MLTCHPLIPRGADKIMDGRVPEKLEIKGKLLLYYHKRTHLHHIHCNIDVQKKCT